MMLTVLCLSVYRRTTLDPVGGPTQHPIARPKNMQVRVRIVQWAVLVSVWQLWGVVCVWGCGVLCMVTLCVQMEYTQQPSGINDLNNPPPVRMSETPPGPGPSTYQRPPKQHPGGIVFPKQVRPKNTLGLSQCYAIDHTQDLGGGRPGLDFQLPGEVPNTAPPTMACPLCGKDDFKTQTDLELHSAQCM